MPMAMAGCFLDLFFFQLNRGRGLWKGSWLGTCDVSIRRSEKTLDGSWKRNGIGIEMVARIEELERERERERRIGSRLLMVVSVGVVIPIKRNK
jgi:hypothetical protein